MRSSKRNDVIVVSSFSFRTYEVLRPADLREKVWFLKPWTVWPTFSRFGEYANVRDGCKVTCPLTQSVSYSHKVVHISAPAFFSFALGWTSIQENEREASGIIRVNHLMHDHHHHHLPRGSYKGRETSSTSLWHPHSFLFFELFLVRCPAARARGAYLQWVFIRSHQSFAKFQLVAMQWVLLGLFKVPPVMTVNNPLCIFGRSACNGHIFVQPRDLRKLDALQ